MPSLLTILNIALEVFVGSLIGLSFVMGLTMFWERRVSTGRPLRRSIDKAIAQQHRPNWRDEDSVDHGGSECLVADRRFEKFDADIDDDYPQ